jgi:hypothetical protein
MGFSINHPAIGVPPWRPGNPHFFPQKGEPRSYFQDWGFIESGQEVTLWQSVPSSLNENKICKSTDRRDFAASLPECLFKNMLFSISLDWKPSSSYRSAAFSALPGAEVRGLMPWCELAGPGRRPGSWPPHELKWTRFLRSTGGEVNLPEDVNVTTHKEPPIWGEIVWMGVWRREANATQDLVEAWLAVLTWKFTTASSKAFWCGDLSYYTWWDKHPDILIFIRVPGFSCIAIFACCWAWPLPFYGGWPPLDVLPQPRSSQAAWPLAKRLGTTLRASNEEARGLSGSGSKQRALEQSVKPCYL